MPRNGAGQYSAPIGTLGVSGTIISSSAYDGFIGDLSTEITNSINVQGTAPMLAALNMAGQQILGMGAGDPTHPSSAVTYAQLQAILPSGAVFWFAAATPPAGFLGMQWRVSLNDHLRDPVRGHWPHLRRHGR